MKTCWDCKVEKDLEQFYKMKRSRDGRSGRCKECEKRYKKEKYREAAENYCGPTARESKCTSCGEIKPANKFANHPRGPNRS